MISPRLPSRPARKSAHPPAPPNASSAAPQAAALAPLVTTIARATRGVQEQPTPIPGLSLFRRDTITLPAYCFIKPSLVLVVQGVKQMVIGTDTYRYDTTRFLLTSLDMPARSEVLAASPAAPCLGLNYELDLQAIAELSAHAKPPAAPEPAASQGKRGEGPKDKKGEALDSRSVGIGCVTRPLLDAFQRLLALLDEPDAIPTLAPLIQREIHYRLLNGDQAARLRKIAAIDSQAHKVAKAIDWLSLHYAAPLSIEQLAAHVQMSPSSFHHHFRALTAMSPLQYQKRLRLNEARRLMLNARLDAASAAFQVGYESPSQFSREYRRLFGSPPKRDIATLRPRRTPSAIRPKANKKAGGTVSEPPARIDRIRAQFLYTS